MFFNRGDSNDAPSQDDRATGNESTGSPSLPKLLSGKIWEVYRVFYLENKVVYADSGEAMKIAAENFGDVQVQGFLVKCFDGIVSMFLDQKAHTVDSPLLAYFDMLFKSSCFIIIQDMTERCSLRFLDTLNKLVYSRSIYYMSTDDHDTSANYYSLKPVPPIFRGYKTRVSFIRLFESQGGFDNLGEFLRGEVLPILDSKSSAFSFSQNKMNASSTKVPPPKNSKAAAIDIVQIRLLLSVFVSAKDIIGTSRAEEAANWAIDAVERIDISLLKSQESNEFLLLYETLEEVLGGDASLKNYLRSLALRMFRSRSFGLQSLGLDMMCKAIISAESVEPSEAALASNFGSRIHNYFGLSQSLGLGKEDMSPKPDSKSGEKGGTAEMKNWLVQNKMVESLFDSASGSAHVALVGKSKPLLEFLARNDAISSNQLDLMFKCCFGAHDSVRGAIYTLLAELALGENIEERISLYILQCATHFADNHRDGMIFLADKIISVLADSERKESKVVVLEALLDFLWRLLESCPKFIESERGRLADFFVEVLRSQAPRSLCIVYIVRMVKTLWQFSSMKRSSFQWSSMVKILSVYETLLKVISLYEANESLMVNENCQLNSTELTNLKDFSVRDPSATMKPLNETTAEAVNEDFDFPTSDLFELATKASSSGTRLWKSQSELLTALEDNYGLLELIANETKIYMNSVKLGNDKDNLASFEIGRMHSRNLQCRLYLLHFCVSRSSLQLTFKLVDQLWRAMNTSSDREFCMAWLSRVAQPIDERKFGLSNSVTKQVFSQLLCEGMNFHNLTVSGFNCFAAFFLAVNQAEGIIEGNILRSLTVTSKLETEPFDGIFTNFPDGHDQTDIVSDGMSSAECSSNSSGKINSNLSKKAGKFQGSFLYEPCVNSGRPSHVKQNREFNDRNVDLRRDVGHLKYSTISNDASRMSAWSGKIEGLSSPEYRGSYTKDCSRSGKLDMRILAVNHKKVFGFSSLWRIVEVAPEEACANAMDLLLQVQCHIEGLEERLAHSANKLRRGFISSLQRRTAFLDRCLTLLPAAGSSVVQADLNQQSCRCQRLLRCIRLIRSYMRLFAQSTCAICHTAPKDIEVSLAVQHDKLLLFSELDVGKIVSMVLPRQEQKQPVAGSWFTGTTFSGTATRFQAVKGIIVRYNACERTHLLCTADGRSIIICFGDMRFLRRSGEYLDEKDYFIISRASLTNHSLEEFFPHLLKPSSKFRQEVWRAWEAYEPFRVQVGTSNSLKYLRHVVFQMLNTSADDCTTSDCVSILVEENHPFMDKIQLYFRSYEYTPDSSAENRKTVQNSDCDDFLINDSDMSVGELLHIENTFDSSLRLNVSAENHVLILDCRDDSLEAETQNCYHTGLYVTKLDHLPSVMIASKKNDYFNRLIALLDDVHIPCEIRLELWNFLVSIPTSQEELDRLIFNYESIVWRDEFDYLKGGFFRTLYKLILIGHLLSNKDAGAIGSTTEQREALMDASVLRQWRNKFIESGGFQIAIDTLDFIVNGRGGKLDDIWSWLWHSKLTLPIIVRIIRRCIQGAVLTVDEESDSSYSLKPGGTRASDVFIENYLQSHILEAIIDKEGGVVHFSPSRRFEVAEPELLRPLVRSLTKVVINLHCKRSSKSQSVSENRNSAALDSTIELQIASEDIDDSIMSCGICESVSVFDIIDNTDDGQQGSIESEDPNTAEFLVDTVLTLYMIINYGICDEQSLSMYSLANPFVTGETVTEKNICQKRYRENEASSLTDVLALSKFPVVRKMLLDLFGAICRQSEKNKLLVLEMVCATLRYLPAMSKNCDDFFDFLCQEMEDGLLPKKELVEVAVDKLVEYQPHGEIIPHNRNTTPASANLARRATLFKTLRGNPQLNLSEYLKDSMQNSQLRPLMLETLDNTLIGLLDVVSTGLKVSPGSYLSPQGQERLLNALAGRFLRTSANCEGPNMGSAATFTDTRVRIFMILDQLGCSSEVNLHWLANLCETIIKNMSVPTQNDGLDWTYKPMDLCKSPGDFVGLLNQGSMCYQNSVLQQLFMSPRLRECISKAVGALPSLTQSALMKTQDNLKNDLTRDPVIEDTEFSMASQEGNYIIGNFGKLTIFDEKKNRLLRALQHTFAFLKSSSKVWYNPTLFVNASACLNLTDGHLCQNDAAEFFSLTIDYLEDTMRSTAHTAMLKDLLYVSTCTINVRRCKGKHRTESEVRTPYLNLNVGSGMAGPTLHSLNDAIESYFKGEKLSGLECEECQVLNDEVSSGEPQRYDADQVKCFSKLPPIMVIQLQRFDFDYALMQPTKLNHRVSFEHRIDLKRFTKEAVMKRLELEVKMPTAASKLHPKNDPRVKDSDLSCDEKCESDFQKVVEVEKKCEVKPSMKTVYELRGVVVHQGSGANFGHYYSFIMDRKSGLWFRFDDEKVTAFNAANLEKECFGGGIDSLAELQQKQTSVSPNRLRAHGSSKDNNAYLLVYELIDDETISNSLQPKHSSVDTLQYPVNGKFANNCPHLGFLATAKLFVKARRLATKARLSLRIRKWIGEIERTVWEDNRKTQDHDLVLDPLFLEFVYKILQSLSEAGKRVSDLERTLILSPESFAKTTLVGLQVCLKATIRLSAMKRRLEKWGKLLKQMIEKCACIYPVSLAWILEYLCAMKSRNDTLFPLLTSCQDKVTSRFFCSLVTHIVDTSVSFIKSDFDHGKCATGRVNDPLTEKVFSALTQFSKVVVSFLSDVPDDLRCCDALFVVLRTLASHSHLHDVLKSEDCDLASHLLEVFSNNDPSASTGFSQHVDACHAKSFNLDRILLCSMQMDFSDLFDTVSLLLFGFTAQEVRCARSELGKPRISFYAHSGADNLPLHCHSKLLPAVGVGTKFRGTGPSDFVFKFCRFGRSLKALQTFSTLPLYATNWLSKELTLTIAIKNPAAASLLIASMCRHDGALSNEVISQLFRISHQNIIELADSSAQIPMTLLRNYIKSTCHCLSALADIEDSFSVIRLKTIMRELLVLAKGLSHGTVGLNASARLREIKAYTAYSFLKLFGLLLDSHPSMRRISVFEDCDWSSWALPLMDNYSYYQQFGGNPEVFTRTLAKGRAIATLYRTAMCTKTNLHLRLVTFSVVSFEITDAEIEKINGEYCFDGFFSTGESSQIDTITPKFVKVSPDGTALSLYRCLIKDKKYTWYISELSDIPGTKSDTDFYSCACNERSSLPPSTYWKLCSSVDHPPISRMLVSANSFELDPSFDPMKFAFCAKNSKKMLKNFCRDSSVKHELVNVFKKDSCVD